MSEQQPNSEAPTTEANNAEAPGTQGNTEGPLFAVQRVYLKDVSFESPGSPHVFQKEWRPDVDVQINNGIEEMEEGVYEVYMKITVEAQMDNKPVFLVEVVQAGIFTFQGFEEKKMEHIRSTLCPSILYPYAREAITDLVTKGSFPQFLLAPVNFDYVFRSSKKSASDQEQSGLIG
ncbi:MAG: protein-export chaperone SecB [Gammaproteobacteria bacterium]|nr:MAG: protein-export chaperone SecB [Gammaproteobacteria bacterium]